MSSYITYEEYTNLGGTVTEDVFNTTLIDVTSKINYITVGRIDAMYNSEDVTEDFISTIKNLIVKLIGFTVSTSTESVKTGISNYSNGIETIGYFNDAQTIVEKTDLKRVSSICKEYLWRYPELFYRGINNGC